VDIFKRTERIGEKLALIGLFDFVNPDLTRMINLSDLKEAISHSQGMLNKWLWARFKQREKGLRVHPLRNLFDFFLFILAIRGLKRTLGKDHVYFLKEANFDLEILLWQLKKTVETLRKIRRMNEKRERLFNELIESLSIFSTLL